MKKISKKLVSGALSISLLSGGIGVYAGTVIESYKTPRGNIATVENEEIHKQRIGITVNGTTVKNPSWYSNGVTYVPIRNAAEMLGATVNYNSSTMSADITLASDGSGSENIFNKITLQENYMGICYSGDILDPKASWPFEFKITSLDANTGKFEGEMNWTSLNSVHKVEGTLTDNQITFKETKYIKKGDATLNSTYTLDYAKEENLYLGTWKQKGGVFSSGDGGDIFIGLD